MPENKKLFSVLKDLKIASWRAVEFLASKGHTIDSNPNFRLSEELYDLLMKEFGDPNLKKPNTLPADEQSKTIDTDIQQPVSDIQKRFLNKINKSAEKSTAATTTSVETSSPSGNDAANEAASSTDKLAEKSVPTPAHGGGDSSDADTNQKDNETKPKHPSSTPTIDSDSDSDSARHQQETTKQPQQSAETKPTALITTDSAPDTSPDNAKTTDKKQDNAIHAVADATAVISSETKPESATATATATATKTDTESATATASITATTTTTDTKPQAKQSTTDTTGTKSETPASETAASTPSTSAETSIADASKPATAESATGEKSESAPNDSEEQHKESGEGNGGSRKKRHRSGKNRHGKKPSVEGYTVVDDDGDEVFRIGSREKPALKVLDVVDLDSMNQKLSPGKKSPEELRKIHEEKRNADRKRGEQQQQSKSSGGSNSSGGGNKKDDNKKKKRERIRTGLIDPNNFTGGSDKRRDKDEKGGGGGGGERQKQTQRGGERGGGERGGKRPFRPDTNEQDVQDEAKRRYKELTSGATKPPKGKGAKYRKDKREAAAEREREAMEAEERESKVLKLTEFVTANDLANMMDIPVTQVISTCMSIGIFVSINQRLDAETINIVAEEFGFTTEYVSAEVVEAITEEADSEEDLVERPPIVTVMGHVDHGKTSLLDNIRKTNVIAGEAGGITQHIGAYNVKLPNGRHITFLDTPGHEAFTAMRARGAKVTDIAIIIVAADDSVMPQTIEAINHAAAANVPIVFAINKIDKPNANPEKIKEALANMNYLVEDWGGKYQCQEISAKQGVGVPELLEKVLLEADLLELKANPNRRATGSVIESTLDKGRGFVSTILVSNGTLRQGDIALAGTHYGRIKAMFNERNQRIKTAAPSEPVIILGLDGAPQAGDTFNVLETEQEAREIAAKREQLQRELGLRTQKRFGLDELGRRRALGDFHELNLIVKGDVDGSVEALSDSLIKLSTEEVQVHVIHKAVGQISESDVSLAATASAVIIGFQVRPSTQARKVADAEGVEIRLYSIIYDAINEVRDAMEGMLSPEIREDICGEIEVQQVFNITKVGTIAGCIVREGKIKRTNHVRVIRDGIVVHTGDISSLKRFKDEAKEVFTGQECGIFINNFNDVQVGDVIEPFDRIEIKKTL